ncbi:tRNA glutamyl-Q(34) synthetase GluQRS [Paenibacillus beijingensis]|uniref:Glutamyl-Q tRNA(Asp) synthetase n=1 Tax=Paenibacillus beijingensis TaxID=1126833 RepID=A0A0D5NNU7_9BACL|nr:tRNA glutamyl-Q(34) synthetase GluQRS [Paenibacillus beijingensis]AJY76667.1 glutamyl-Q tRNA(Asp) ligase [Paenibacillus beijingensis]
MRLIRGRFAPTPSGLMHIGNARTALLAWLLIRSRGGEFILRMEDIDRPRSKPRFAEQIVSDMRWLGLNWDEGPDTGGPFGPYTQSERLELYESALRKLEREGKLYPCYCSRAELLAVASAPHGLASEGPQYPGTCRCLSPQERLERARVKTPSLRFRVPDEPVHFRDEAAGDQTAPAGAGGDFIVRRADGIISYQLAVVVDDAAMMVTDVLRGVDLLDSTPRQLYLYDGLGLTPPRFAHVPLLNGSDGKRLAKRHGAVSLHAIRESGTPPETVIGCLAYLSGLLDRPEPVKSAELAADFKLERVPREAVEVDERLLQMLAGNTGKRI